jgi:hypothetical protein
MLPHGPAAPSMVWPVEGSAGLCPPGEVLAEGARGGAATAAAAAVVGFGAPGGPATSERTRGCWAEGDASTTAVISLAAGSFSGSTGAAAARSRCASREPDHHQVFSCQLPAYSGCPGHASSTRHSACPDPVEPAPCVNKMPLAGHQTGVITLLGCPC